MRWIKIGQSIVKKSDDDWMMKALGTDETMSSTKDRRGEAVCAPCGKPAAQDFQLKQCSGKVL